MFLILAILLISAFVGSGFIKRTWLRIPAMIICLGIACYASLQIGIQFQRTKFISDFMAPLSQFSYSLTEIQDDAMLRQTIIKWNESIQKSRYESVPIRDAMFSTIEELEKKKAPNQSPETTTMTVTPAASHPSRQP